MINTTIGDITVSGDTIVTPNGDMPLAGSRWIVLDETKTETKIPTYAIVLAIILAFACLLGLLFLLIKETKTSGYVVVQVSNDGAFHQAQVPVYMPQQVEGIRRQVSQIQIAAANKPN